jgi:transcriptional regulator with XRE-family HTH domain
MPYFGDNPIRFLREQQGLKLDMLAIESGLTPAYLCKLEIGMERRWTTRLRALAAVLGVPVEEIVAA